MKQLLKYIRAINTHKDEPAHLETMKEKFKDLDVEKTLTQLMRQGMIWEPRPGIYRSLD